MIRWKLQAGIDRVFLIHKDYPIEMELSTPSLSYRIGNLAEEITFIMKPSDHTDRQVIEYSSSQLESVSLRLTYQFGEHLVIREAVKNISDQVLFLDRLIYPGSKVRMGNQAGEW